MSKQTLDGDDLWRMVCWTARLDVAKMKEPENRVTVEKCKAIVVGKGGFKVVGP